MTHSQTEMAIWSEYSPDPPPCLYLQPWKPPKRKFRMAKYIYRLCGTKQGQRMKITTKPERNV